MQGIKTRKKQRATRREINEVIKAMEKEVHYEEINEDACDVVGGNWWI